MFYDRTASFLPVFSASMLIFTVSGTSQSDVLTVDDDDPAADFATIQEAVDAAADGDHIEVGPGYYVADSKSANSVVKIDGKSIEIVAVNIDPSLTVIVGQGLRRCVEWSDGAENCKLGGFTLDAGFSDTDGGGLWIDRSAVEVQGCVFTGCTAVGSGGAITSISEVALPPIVRGCRFLGNIAGLSGGGIHADGGFDLYDGVFENDTAGSFGLPFFCVNEPVTLAVCRLPLGSSVENTRFCDYTEAPLAGVWNDLGGNSFNPVECNAADVNGDGEVNGADLALVLVGWEF